MNDTEPLVVGQKVKATYSLPGEPIAAVFEIVSEDACHYYIRRYGMSGHVHRLPKRNVVAFELF